MSLQSPCPAEPQSRNARIAARFGGDRRGVAAVEFALIVPIMLVLLIGSVEFNRIFTLDRKVGQAAASVADLVAQVSSISSSDLNDVLKISGAILDPYPESGIKLVVSSLRVKGSGKTEVMWSRGLNTAKWSTGAAPPVSVPSGLTEEKDTYLIVAHTTYTYQPLFATLFKDVINSDTIELEEIYYARPRLSASVDCCS